MTGNFLTKRFILLVLLILASACATSPIAEQYRVDAKEDNLPFPMALQNPDKYVGDSVLWGGVVIQTDNMRKGSQVIVLETTLDDDTRPMDPRDSTGRFIAKSEDFLDPELYQKGREVTVAGVVTGKKILPIGDTKYAYPVVTVKQIYLWEKKKDPPEYRYVYPYSYWGWGPHFHWGGGYYWRRHRWRHH